MSDLECKVCADPSVTSPHGVPAATPGQAAPVMPESAVLRAAILATEDSASDAAPDWTDRERLDGIIASWIGRELPPGTPSSVAASAAQCVTAGLAPFVEAEALRLAQAAAQEPHAAPELAAAMRETRFLRAGIAALTVRLDASARATSPSKKSNIEAEIAIALRKLMEGE